jgi:hypothetical protein
MVFIRDPLTGPVRVSVIRRQTVALPQAGAFEALVIGKLTAAIIYGALSGVMDLKTV